MSTRCNIILEHGDTRVLLYRHMDGYMSCTGAELAKLIGAARTADALLRAFLAESYAATEFRPAKPIYELTSEIHGDIDYLYRITFPERDYYAGTAPDVRIGYIMRARFASEELHKRTHAIPMLERATFVELVNLDIRDYNKRLAQLFERTQRAEYATPQQEIA